MLGEIIIRIQATLDQDGLTHVEFRPNITT